MGYDFHGRTFVVTGATSGLGRGLTKLLIEKEDCRVIGVGRSEEKFKTLISELGGKAEKLIPVKMDVGREEDWKKLAEDPAQREILLDGVINCAGVLPPFRRAVDFTSDEIREVLSTDFMSCVYSVAYLYPLISRSDAPAIVNVSSSAALASVAGTAGYTAAKCALKGYTEALGAELDRVFVSLVMPGFTRTGIFRSQGGREKNSRLIKLASTSEEKMTGIIYRRLKQGKRRIIAGKDAHLMNFYFGLFPRSAPKVTAKILKKYAGELFRDVFKGAE